VIRIRVNDASGSSRSVTLNGSMSAATEADLTTAIAAAHRAATAVDDLHRVLSALAAVRPSLARAAEASVLAVEFVTVAHAELRMRAAADAGAELFRAS
jgi:hypothetical protein